MLFIPFRTIHRSLDSKEDYTALHGNQGRDLVGVSVLNHRLSVAGP